MKLISNHKLSILGVLVLVGLMVFYIMSTFWSPRPSFSARDLRKAAVGISAITNSSCVYASSIQKQSDEQIKAQSLKLLNKLKTDGHASMGFKVSLSSAIEFKNYPRAQEILIQYYCKN